MDLDGRSALVTGGAGGLGAATARRPGEAGRGVAVFDRAADRAEHGDDDARRGERGRLAGAFRADDRDAPALCGPEGDPWQDARPAIATMNTGKLEQAHATAPLSPPAAFGCGDQILE